MKINLSFFSCPHFLELRVGGPEEEQRADLWMDRVTEDVKSVDVRQEEAADSASDGGA